ncbi:formate/nitrite transporter family protein [Thauera sinica]|uniref:Formate/nitrite transporter family protein n=1 Tax=Thauera sinica TaxID=2665146 RepID=A0ABW1AQ76_9RHOO|nr:formate/nitrite transporter family protein [Thauera sp. K11]ATE59527.1 formate transporter FocA [Thauera sp. K11]
MVGTTRPEHPLQAGSFESLPPPAIAQAAEGNYRKKAMQYGSTLFALAILGGAFVALGGMFATVAATGSQTSLPYGVGRLLLGSVFSLGLILVVVAGAQLFTSDALMVMAWASGRLRTSRMLLAWTTVWCGNLVGALGTAVLVFLSGQYLFGHGQVGATALYLAYAKSSLPPSQAFFLGILCNVLVCLAAWLALSARSVADKIVALFFPITAFVAAGFEHCVANMYFVPYGMLIQWFAPDSFWADLARLDFGSNLPFISPTDFLRNLAVVTLGNWVGGGLLVGGMYWLIYRRPADAARSEKAD